MGCSKSKEQEVRPGMFLVNDMGSQENDGYKKIPKISKFPDKDQETHVIPLEFMSKETNNKPHKQSNKSVEDKSVQTQIGGAISVDWTTLHQVREEKSKEPSKKSLPSRSDSTDYVSSKASHITRRGKQPVDVDEPPKDRGPDTKGKKRSEDSSESKSRGKEKSSKSEVRRTGESSHHTGERYQHRDRAPKEGDDSRIIECPDLKCHKELPLKHLMNHIRHKHLFALWMGKVKENAISRQYWNIRSHVNFEKEENTWVLTIWEFEDHFFIACFTRMGKQWYSWVYCVSDEQEAKKYIVEVRIASDARGTGFCYKGKVHSIDQRGNDIRLHADCLVLSDEVIKKYMTAEGLSAERKNEGYDYRIPIEYKIFRA